MHLHDLADRLVGQVLAVALVEGRDPVGAQAQRVHLVRAARDYVDVQNFILRKDETGELFLNELLGAARRGVVADLTTRQG